MLTLRASRLARSVSLVMANQAGEEHRFTEEYDITHHGAAPPPVWAGEKLWAIAATFPYVKYFEWPNAADDTIGLPVLQMCTFFCLALFDADAHVYLRDALDAFKPVFNHTPAPLAIDELDRGENSPRQRFAREVATAGTCQGTHASSHPARQGRGGRRQ